ncbi:MAG: response regulator [Verrucomicrobiota bacterium]
MDEPPASRLKVLIVEDDQITARDLEETLKRRGFMVSGVAHSADAVPPLIATEMPGVALLNIDLGSSDSGIELAKKLREEHQVPVIFITGYSEDSLYERARDARPAGFLRKPFSDAELIVLLESFSERSVADERLSDRLPGIQAVAAQLAQGVIATDLDGQVVYLNTAAETLTGWSAHEIAQIPLSSVAPIERSGENSHLRQRNGEQIAITERSEPIKSLDGEALGLVTVIEPITSAPASSPREFEPIPEGAPSPPARDSAVKKIAALSRDPAFRELIKKRAPEPANAPPPPETEPGVAESVFTAAGANLIDEVGDPLIKVDESSNILYANPEAIAVLGDSRPLEGRSFWNLFAAGEREKYEESFNRPFADKSRNRFDFHDSKRGLWFEVRTYRTEGGLLALFSDITSSKLDAAESVRQQRLEGLGLLARGFAHDFNNHLTTITGNVSLAREKYTEDAELQQMLSEAQAATAGATGLVQQLMTFARGGRPIRKRTRIPDLIRRILTEHRLNHPEIRYQFQGAATDLVANVDPAQISRLVENLVSNSAVAMPDGGVLVVRCDRISPEKVLEVRGNHVPADEDHLLIEVIDTGSGMDENALGRVFEPYFTTRNSDNATGIGLTVCESIAKAHGGFIQLQSKEGKGTIATFCAPTGLNPEITESDQPIELPTEAIENAPVPTGQLRQGEPLLVGTRILILEDDAPIRRLMAATLRRAGHDVVETKDGRETIAVYREAMERGERFHLLICDLTIENGVGGVETMRQLVEQDPQILAIVSSGYSDAPAMASPASFGFKGVLPKPYAPSELRAAVHRILTAHHIIS